MFFRKKNPQQHEYHVRGTSYHHDAISMLAVQNPLYNSNKAILESGKAMQRVYQFLYVDKPVQLKPEKNNKNDKNAVMILIAGQHVGYIPRENAEEVRKDIKRGISGLEWDGTPRLHGHE